MSTTITEIEIKITGSVAQSLHDLLHKVNKSRLKRGDHIIESTDYDVIILREDLIQAIQSYQHRSALIFPSIQMKVGEWNDPQAAVQSENFQQSTRPIIISNALAVQIIDMAAQVADQNAALTRRLKDLIESESRWAQRAQHEAREADHWRATANELAKRLASLLAIKGVKKLAGRHGLLARWFKTDGGKPA